MTAHAVIRQVIPAGREETFDLLHDYPRRLTWDTLLRRAYTVDDAPPGPGVEAVCHARRSLGGLTFRTRYVTFRRPELAAVRLVGSAPLLSPGQRPSVTSRSTTAGTRSSTRSRSAAAPRRSPG